MYSVLLGEKKRIFTSSCIVYINDIFERTSSNQNLNGHD